MHKYFTMSVLQIMELKAWIAANYPSIDLSRKAYFADKDAFLANFMHALELFDSR